MSGWVGKNKGAVFYIAVAIIRLRVGRVGDEGVGGEEYLMGCARDPKTAAAFLTLIGKVLPTTLQGPGPNGEHVFSRIVREVVETK